MSIPVDYDVLRVIWWLFLGVLLIGFAIMDGFDLGVAALLPYVARNDSERRVAINTIGPVWEGNQVWLITGGGAIFAAFPPIYAASFSGFYIAMFLVLAALILRPVGFEFRNKIADTRWRAFWDYALFAGGLVPSLVFGVAFGNILQGVPFRIDSDLRVLYEGSGLFGTAQSVRPVVRAGVARDADDARRGLSDAQGGRPGEGARRRLRAHRRARHGRAVRPRRHLDRLRHQGLRDHQHDRRRRPVQPAAQDGRTGARAVVRQLRRLQMDDARAGARHRRTAANHHVHRTRRAGLAFVASAIGIFGVISTAGVSMFPFLMPSDIMPQASLTVWDATSSQLTLFVMLLATLIFLPIVLAYTGFAFRVMRGPVTAKQIEGNSANHY